MDQLIISEKKLCLKCNRCCPCGPSLLSSVEISRTIVISCNMKRQRHMKAKSKNKVKHFFSFICCILCSLVHIRSVLISTSSPLQPFRFIHVSFYTNGTLLEIPQVQQVQIPFRHFKVFIGVGLSQNRPKN